MTCELSRSGFLTTRERERWWRTQADARVYFLLFYQKNQQASLSEAGKRRLQAIVTALKEGNA